MPGIADIEDAIKARLTATIAGIDDLVRSVPKPSGSPVLVPVQVKSYPKRPSEQTLKSLAAAGAVLVRYAGSKFGKKRTSGGITVQDETMFFEVLAIADSLRAEDAHEGVYEFLQVCEARLIDYRPSSCVDGFELVDVNYLSEKNGAWEYGLLVSVKTQMVKSNGN